MRKYNGLLRTLSHAIAIGALGLTTILAGCAHQTPRSDADAFTDRESAAPSSQSQPVLQTRKLATKVRADAPRRYMVQRGDTLWDIAGYYLRDPWYWPQLWQTNPDIANPHLIYPGDVLILTRGQAGEPRLRRAGTQRQAGVEQLSPRIRERPLDDAIATVPLDALRAFLTGPRVVSEEDLDAAPYIVSFIEAHLVGSEGMTAYLRGVPADRLADYSIVRATGPYTDPETGESLGRKAIPVGELQIDVSGDPATATITRSYREALSGDRLLPIENRDLIHDFYPHAPAEPIAGQIISVHDGVSTIGQYQVVTLNRGRRDGLERGHVMDIYQTGRVVIDPVAGGRVHLPERRAGRLLVFKTDAEVAFAVIMRARRAIHIEDTVRSPA